MTPAKKHFDTRRAAFTLVELAVVLAIIGLIAGAGIAMASSAIKTADRVATQERLGSIKLALDSFAKTYGYLPCPADRTYTTSNANFGLEQRDTPLPSTVCNTGSGIVASGSVTIGMVPVRTLGLPDSYASDSWGNKIEYAVTSALAASPSAYQSSAGAIVMKSGTLSSSNTLSSIRKSASYTAVANNGAGLARLTFVSTGTLTDGYIVHVNGSVYTGSFTVSGKTATTIDLTGSTYSANDTGTVEWLEPGAYAAYAVISHGPDGRGGYPLAAAAIPNTKKCNNSATANSSPPPCTSNANTNCIDIENCNDDATFFDTAYNESDTTGVQYFDDFIVWGSNALNRAPINAALYFDGASLGCPTGICEAWCATCTANYPGGNTTVPPTGDISGGAVLCRKIVTGTSASCTASCFWAGTNINGKGAATAGYQKCL